MTSSLHLQTAAKMAQDSYLRNTKQLGGRNFLIPPLRGDATAFLIKGNILVIQGSNSVADYLKYNLRVLRFGQKKLKMNANTTAKDKRGAVWHQGFLYHALEIQNWLQSHRQRPKFIVGHSLGAAATQVLSAAYGVPGIGFAAPRICMRSPASLRKDRCLLICRSDDIVAQIPNGFDHLGDTRTLRVVHGPWPRHKMKHYTSLLPQLISQRKLPKQWP